LFEKGREIVHLYFNLVAALEPLVGHKIFIGRLSDRAVVFDQLALILEEVFVVRERVVHPRDELRAQSNEVEPNNLDARVEAEGNLEPLS